LFLNATPVSIFNDVTNAAVYTNVVVDVEPTGASFSTGGTAYNLTSVVLVLSNETEVVIPDTVPASRTSHGMRSRHASSQVAKAPKAKASKVRKAADPAAGIIVQLFSDTGGPYPGTLLATSSTTLLDTSLGDSPAPFSFPFANYPLAANTRYWVIVSSPDDDSVAVWWGSSDISGTDVTPEYYLYFGDIDANSAGEDSSAYLMQVIGDPSTLPPTTPAPASVMLVLIGLGCAAWYFRRRKVLQSS
jgi:hypothetical protein